MNLRQSNKGINEIIAALRKFLQKGVVYLPILGPTYIQKKHIRGFLLDLFKNSTTDKFLPYDKNKRWFDRKPEKIIFSRIIVYNNAISIPIKINNKEKFKIFYYSHEPINKKTIKLLKNSYNDIKELKIYCFKEPKIKSHIISHDIYLKRIGFKDTLINFPDEIYFYKDLSKEIKKTFVKFLKESKFHNFYFFYEKFINENKNLNSLICATKKNKIVGAIGPLDITKDYWGTQFLFPPNFGVISRMRSMGFGTKLWKAGVGYSYQEGAKYTLVQNIPKSPAAKFYEKQGLLSAGKVYSFIIQNKICNNKKTSYNKTIEN